MGGIVVGGLSGSRTSVSGGSPALIAIVSAQTTALGGFDGFLTAVLLAGIIQVAFGLLKAGFISSFFPTSVIKGTACSDWHYYHSEATASFNRL